jgi:hypothetical protein
MAHGPGKYDDLCTQVREHTEAEGVILMVFNGNQGQGFSCQLSPILTHLVPHLLREVADQIEEDMKAAKQ